MVDIEKKKYIKIVQFDIDERFYGYRVDKFLSTKMPWYSRTEIDSYIERGDFLLNGKLAKKGTRLKLKDQLIRRYYREEPNIDVDKIEIPLIYEDENIAVFNKPPTIAIHPNSAYQSGTMVQILEEKYGYQGLKLVHRIDKETSGLVIMAKNINYAQYLTKAFFNREIKKEYLAFVKGEVKDKNFTIKINLGKDIKSIVRIKQWENIDGVYSHTDFKLIKQYENYALVLAKLNTGRQHQIRAHLSYYGNYIVGDKIYGPDETIFDRFTESGLTKEMLNILEIDRHLLHAHRLSFYDSKRGINFTFKAPIPDDMKKFIRGKVIKGKLWKNLY